LVALLPLILRYQGPAATVLAKAIGAERGDVAARFRLGFCAPLEGSDRWVASRLISEAITEDGTSR
jgi:hypothetical protein